jgi:hypothetical protein
VDTDTKYWDVTIPLWIMNRLREMSGGHPADMDAYENDLRVAALQIDGIAQAFGMNTRQTLLCAYYYLHGQQIALDDE